MDHVPSSLLLLSMVFTQCILSNMLCVMCCCRCWCGLSYAQHCVAGAAGAGVTGAGLPGLGPPPPTEAWTAARHTRAQPTDAYGTIEFQGGPHPTKAQVGCNHLYTPPCIQTFFLSARSHYN